jgi:hypothetical protein
MRIAHILAAAALLIAPLALSDGAGAQPRNKILADKAIKTIDTKVPKPSKIRFDCGDRPCKELAPKTLKRPGPSDLSTRVPGVNRPKTVGR